MCHELRKVSHPSITYLRILERLRISPNFFMSAEYLDCKQLHWGYHGELWGCREDDAWFLPPLYLDAGGSGAVWRLCYDVPCWAGLPDDRRGKFLDYEFIYDPSRFVDLSGPEWAVFRKNVRKWPARTKGHFEYRALCPGEAFEEVVSLLLVWAGTREVYDPETMLRCATQFNSRWGLYRGGVLVGLNVADQNWAFTNYRLCVDNGDGFLQEYLRLCFYRNCAVGTLVNDGGCLGSDGLERFKRKLQPKIVRELYTRS